MDETHKKISEFLEEFKKQYKGTEEFAQKIKDLTPHEVQNIMVDELRKGFTKEENQITELEQQAKNAKDPTDAKILLLEAETAKGFLALQRIIGMHELISIETNDVLGKLVKLTEIIFEKLPEDEETEKVKSELNELLKHKSNLEWLARRLEDEGKTTQD